MERKDLFIEKLGELLRDYSREKIKGFTYYISVSGDGENFEEILIITFNSGFSKIIDVTRDNCLAIMHDVYKALATKKPEKSA